MLLHCSVYNDTAKKQELKFVYQSLVSPVKHQSMLIIQIFDFQGEALVCLKAGIKI